MQHWELKTTHLSFKLPCKKIKLLQISDLHMHPLMSERVEQRLISKAKEFKPDLIVLTGDCICYGEMNVLARLNQFLNKIEAPLGKFAVLGNHDFEKPLSINREGVYDTVQKPSSLVTKGFKSLLFVPKIVRKTSERAKNLKPNPELIQLFQKTNVKLLNNKTVQIGEYINLTGLGEYMAGQAHPQEAFKNYNKSLPGVILAHNPDTFPHLKNYPGDLVLSGHTHGGQMNLPWLWHRFCNLENPHFRKGMIKENGKTMYVSRGVGGVMPFRINSFPELVCITIGENG